MTTIERLTRAPKLLRGAWLWTAASPNLKLSDASHLLPADVFAQMPRSSDYEGGRFKGDTAYYSTYDDAMLALEAGCRRLSSASQ